MSKYNDVIYVFKKAKDNISLADRDEFPKLFYGFFEVKKLLNTYFIDAFEELEGSSYIKYIMRYLKAKFGISERFSYFSPGTIDKMNKAKLIYATTDGLALSLADLKKKNLLRTKLVVNLMAIFDNPTYSNKIGHLDYVDSIVVFTFPLATKLEELGHLNVHFVPYGTDTNFYAPWNCTFLQAKRGNPVVLGIGLDKKRDWDKFKQIAKKLKHLEFKVITHDNLRKEFEGFTNITFLGNVSFLRTREEMCEADALFLPTKDNFYFSGQITLFNALAMKKPVVMPHDANFKNYGFDKTLFYDRDCSLEDIINLIKIGIGKDESVMKSIEFNHNLVIREYNQIKFAKKLMDVFLSCGKAK